MCRAASEFWLNRKMSIGSIQHGLFLVLSDCNDICSKNVLLNCAINFKHPPTREEGSVKDKPRNSCELCT